MALTRSCQEFYNLDLEAEHMTKLAGMMRQHKEEVNDLQWRELRLHIVYWMHLFENTRETGDHLQQLKYEHFQMALALCKQMNPVPVTHSYKINMFMDIISSVKEKAKLGVKFKCFLGCLIDRLVEDTEYVKIEGRAEMS